MAAVPPSASFRSRREGPRFIALRMSVDPAPAANIAAVLPAFCAFVCFREAGYAWRWDVAEKDVLCCVRR